MQKKVGGKTANIKQTYIDRLTELFDIEAVSFIPGDIIDVISEITGSINCEISVLIARKGGVLSVNIGDSDTVSIDNDIVFRDIKRFSGVRCIHTHPNGNPHLSDIDISALERLRMDAMIAVGVNNGKPTSMYIAVNGPVHAEEEGPYYPYSSKTDTYFEIIKENEKERLRLSEGDKNDDKEKVILIGRYETNLDNGKERAEISVNELKALADTAGCETVAAIVQKKKDIDNAFYIGKGKTEEISLLGQTLNADTVIFDDELTGAQIKNIEDVTGLKVIDRTMLILDIFAAGATSSEGKLQVELAQMRYRLPRLLGLGKKLSRLGGGIGTRGPGESKLVSDRMHIRQRIHNLEDELRNIESNREVLRKERKKSGIPTVAIVGYTNAGKSTLLNKLCNAGVFAEDKLFATLDTTTRKFKLTTGKEILLIDTVGFIRKLPHDIIEAFKSTLKEAMNADVIIHLADCSDPELDSHIAVAEELLISLNANDTDPLLVFNKSDRINEYPIISREYMKKRPILISAKTGEGIDEFIAALSDKIENTMTEALFLIPWGDGAAESRLRACGIIENIEYTESGTILKVKLSEEDCEREKRYRIDS